MKTAKTIITPLKFRLRPCCCKMQHRSVLCLPLWRSAHFRLEMAFFPLSWWFETAGISGSFFEYFQLLSTVWLASVANTTSKIGFACKISEPFLGPQNLVKKRCLSNWAGLSARNKTGVQGPVIAQLLLPHPRLMSVGSILVLAPFVLLEQREILPLPSTSFQNFIED